MLTSYYHLIRKFTHSSWRRNWEPEGPKLGHGCSFGEHNTNKMILYKSVREVTGLVTKKFVLKFVFVPHFKSKLQVSPFKEIHWSLPHVLPWQELSDARSILSRCIIRNRATLLSYASVVCSSGTRVLELFWHTSYIVHIKKVRTVYTKRMSASPQGSEWCHRYLFMAHPRPNSIFPC